eukprot:COSAG01_NODE_9015_length_2581_cov_128.553183_1_plen_71_part_10
MTWTRSGSLTYGPPETVRRIVACATSKPSRNCLRVNLRQREHREQREQRKTVGQVAQIIIVIIIIGIIIII